MRSFAAAIGSPINLTNQPARSSIMESWRMAWREGFAPVLSTKGLESLWHALRNDDARLTQGSTTTPPPMLSMAACPCDGADAIGWCGWRGEQLETVGEVEEFFSRICYEADLRLGEPAASRWFLNWFDDTPRDELRRELLGEIERTLAVRLGIARLPQPIRKRMPAAPVVAA